MLASICCSQGESDARDKKLAMTYGTRLTTLIENVREDLETPDLTFLIGELGYWMQAEPSPDGKGGKQTAHPYHETVTKQSREVSTQASKILILT